MMKKLLFAGLLILLIGGFVGYKVYNKPHQNIAKADSIHSVSAENLFTDYEKSEVNANATYLGKIITVEGKIEELNNKADDKKQIILSTGNMMSRISCDLDHLTKHEKFADLRVGGIVKIKGKCTGLLMDVVMDRCVIL